MLRGYMGLSADSVSAPSPTQPPEEPLQKGPAWGRLPAESPENHLASEWPTYRHDGYRSGGIAVNLTSLKGRKRWASPIARIPSNRRTTEWKANPFVRGPVTPPVVAGNRVLVAAPDEHCVVAVDAARGRPLWTFTAGGRIDLPPTLTDRLCIFGAHDGWVYCLTAETGELVWQFRAAPREVRFPAYGQMESPWPVPGSVLVDRGTAYFAAGRHPRSEGGIHVFAVEMHSGQRLWETTIDKLELQGWYGGMLPRQTNQPPRKIGLDFEPIDILVKDGSALAMSRWQLNPTNGECHLDVANLEYTTPGLKVLRGLWGYGIRQTKKVEAKPPAVFGGRRLFPGTAADTALLLAGETLVRATRQGELKVGDQTLQLPAPVVPDGLAAAYGRIYASLENGEVVCLE